jgi:hypothetical protein
MIFVAVARLGALEGTIIKHLNALLLNLRSPVVIPGLSSDEQEYNPTPIINEIRTLPFDTSSRSRSLKA